MLPHTVVLRCAHLSVHSLPASLSGSAPGDADGLTEGLSVGDPIGLALGGEADGEADGLAEGLSVGDPVGLADGDSVQPQAMGRGSSFVGLALGEVVGADEEAAAPVPQNVPPGQVARAPTSPAESARS